MRPAGATGDSGSRLTLTKLTRSLRALQWRPVPGQVPGLQAVVYEAPLRDDEQRPLRLRLPLREDQGDCSLALAHAVEALSELYELPTTRLAATLASRPGLLDLTEIGERLDSHLDAVARHGAPVALVLLGVADSFSPEGAPGSMALQLREAIRRSDDIGLASSDSVVALLPYTDEKGLESVVRRIRSMGLAPNLDVGTQVVSASTEERPSTRKVYAHAKRALEAARAERLGATR